MIFEFILEMLVYELGRVLRWLYYKGDIKYKDLDDFQLDWLIGSTFYVIIGLIIVFF